MSDTILVTGTIDIDPAKRAEFIDAVTSLMADTRAEDGCVSYTFSGDLQDEGRFHVSEQWRDQAASDAHSASAHFLGFMGKLGEFGVKGADITKWTGAEGAPLF
ncbi:MAG: antibiotic biosynthesis monooxygenase [Actinomycetota bacterium]|nr:antibiotic biosynthesis monooxygenase [Actinomycetota bacterium]